MREAVLRRQQASAGEKTQMHEGSACEPTSRAPIVPETTVRARVARGEPLGDGRVVDHRNGGGEHDEAGAHGAVHGGAAAESWLEPFSME